MQPGRMILIAVVASALTSAGTFFGLQYLVGVKAKARPLRVTDGVPTPPPASPPQEAPLPGDEPQQRAAAAARSRHQPLERVKTTVTEVKRGVVVPKVKGGWLHTATATLRRAGLSYTVTYRYDEDHSENLILDQQPQAGLRVGRGATVKLVVNRDY